MGKYILKRILYAVIALFVVSTIAFFAVRMIPGNPIEAMTEKLPDEIRQQGVSSSTALTSPFWSSISCFFKELFTEGDLGESLKYRGRKVTDTIASYAPVSGLLGAEAIAIGVISGIILGIVAALNRGEMAGLSGHVHRSGWDRGAELRAGVLLPVFSDHPLSSVPHHWMGGIFLYGSSGPGSVL